MLFVDECGAFVWVSAGCKKVKKPMVFELLGCGPEVVQFGCPCKNIEKTHVFDRFLHVEATDRFFIGFSSFFGGVKSGQKHCKSIVFSCFLVILGTCQKMKIFPIVSEYAKVIIFIVKMHVLVSF